MVVLAARIHVFSLPAGGSEGPVQGREAITRLHTFEAFDSNAGGRRAGCWWVEGPFLTCSHVHNFG